MDGIAETIEDTYRDEAVIVTSIIMSVEVLDGDFTTTQKRTFEQTLKSRRIQQINLDPPIVALARNIRDHYKQNKSINIKTPDSIHLASAIIFKVDEFHTFDGHSSKPKKDGLLSLNGTVAGRPLKICLPSPRQPYLIRPTPQEMIERKKKK